MLHRSGTRHIEIPADHDATVGLYDRGTNRTVHVYRCKAGVEAAVGIQPGDAVAGGACNGGKRAGDDQLAIGLLRQCVHVAVGIRIEPGVKILRRDQAGKMANSSHSRVCAMRGTGLQSIPVAPGVVFTCTLCFWWTGALMDYRCNTGRVDAVWQVFVHTGPAGCGAGYWHWQVCLPS